MEKKNKLYVLIDKSLDAVYGCVQGGHAVAQWLIENGSGWRNEYLIYLSADVEKWKACQCCKNGSRPRTCLLYLGHDDGDLRMRYHSGLPASRLLRTADAASALTPPSRCDSG